MTIESILPEIKSEIPDLFASAENANRMANDSNLDAIIKEWVPEEDEIISFKVSERSHAILIVAKNEDDEFSIYRFFPGYDKWNVSVDVQMQTMADAFNNLLSYR